ncbi:MAG: hypothetical protein FJ276_00835 [Planctomycetes bacterium]|nr:hypothetical protein [Planctomycetota bacterium]
MSLNEGWSRWVVLAVLVSSSTGCGRSEKPPVEYGTLPGLRQTHEARLREELCRLEAEKATPVLLDGADRAAEVQELLERILPRQRLALALRRVEKLYPRGAFEFDPVGLEQMLLVREQLDGVLRQYRAVFDSDEFRFEVSFVAGLLADLSFVDHARLVHRLEAMDAARPLVAGRLHEAIAPLERMFRIDARLAAVRHVVPRLAGAELRAETLRVLEAVVQHPQCTAALQRRCLQLLRAQLADWPSDALVWIGDRAVGLHAYEMVRSGDVLSLLTLQEIREKRERMELDAFVRAMTTSVDADELFYLQAMRQLIEACDEPFHVRKKTLEAIGDRLRLLEKTPRYPLFAATVLLPDMTEGHQAQAEDRARCEAWAIVLAAAADGAVPAFETNPVSGQPYRIARDDRQVEVSEIDGPSGGETARARIAGVARGAAADRPRR